MAGCRLTAVKTTSATLMAKAELPKLTASVLCFIKDYQLTERSFSNQRTMRSYRSDVYF
jgi:hypothetical protein